MKILQPKIRSVALALLGTSTLLAASQALAAPVTLWNYVTSAVFVPAGVSFEGGGGGVQIVDDAEISWGAAGGDFQNPTGDSTENRSALTIGVGTSGDFRVGGGSRLGFVDTDLDGGLPMNPGELALGVSLSHWNNPISNTFATLETGRVLSTLTLTPLAPVAGPVQNAPDVLFDFRFVETPNDAACAGGTANPCGDLFGIIGFGNFNQTFEYDGIDYFLSTFVLGPEGEASPVSTLLDEECAALDLANGCQGFRTAENGVTTAQFGFSIGAQPFTEVPEPGSMALLGLGLLGLGAMGRKFKRQA